jgi:outer membrane lipoprotein
LNASSHEWICDFKFLTCQRAKSVKMKMCLEKSILPLGLILVLLLALLSGCVTYPIARNLQQQARPLTLSQVVADPDACQGTMVIWGGRIIKTVNDVNGSAIYVLELPLGDDGQPLAYANTSGRFIASTKEFLDPEVYKRGELITVAGTVAGLESEPVQKTKYTYPVVTIKQTHLWPVERRYYYNYPGGYPDGYWYGYYPDWYWWGWYPGWGWGWGWNYGGDWDGDRGYHYQSGHWEGGHPDGHWGGGYQGGANHYQGGSRGGGHWH